MAQKKLDLRFLLSVTRSDNTLQFRAYLVHLNEEGKVRNLASHYRFEPSFGLADFQVTAQKDIDRDGNWYGFHAEYRDVFSVDVHRAEAMTKTLRKVTKGLAKLEQEEGYVENLGTFLVRVARILGVKGYLFDAGTGTGGWGHDAKNYRHADINEAAWWIARKVLELDPREQVKA